MTLVLSHYMRPHGFHLLGPNFLGPRRSSIIALATSTQTVAAVVDRQRPAGSLILSYHSSILAGSHSWSPTLTWQIVRGSV